MINFIFNTLFKADLTVILSRIMYSTWWAIFSFQVNRLIREGPRGGVDWRKGHRVGVPDPSKRVVMHQRSPDTRRASVGGVECGGGSVRGRRSGVGIERVQWRGWGRSLRGRRGPQQVPQKGRLVFPRQDGRDAVTADRFGLLGAGPGSLPLRVLIFQGHFFKFPKNSLSGWHYSRVCANDSVPQILYYLQKH